MSRWWPEVFARRARDVQCGRTCRNRMRYCNLDAGSLNRYLKCTFEGCHERGDEVLPSARRSHSRLAARIEGRRPDNDSNPGQHAVLEFCRRARRRGDLPVTTRYTEVTEATIIVLVNAFYAKVRRDPVLGPVFDNAIAPDAWPAHLQKMYAFWSSVMLTSGRYKGDPVSAHRKVDGVAPPMFGDWLDLFEATAAELFVPEIADRFICKARRIAESLKLALFYRPD